MFRKYSKANHSPELYLQLLFKHFENLYRILPINHTVRLEVGKFFCRRYVNWQSSILPHTSMIADRMIGRYCTLALSLFIPPLIMKNRPCVLIPTNTVLYFKVIFKSMIGPEGTGLVDPQAPMGLSILLSFNPSNAEATFTQSTRTQRFLKTI